MGRMTVYGPVLLVGLHVVFVLQIPVTANPTFASAQRALITAVQTTAAFNCAATSCDDGGKTPVISFSDASPLSARLPAERAARFRSTDRARADHSRDNIMRAVESWGFTQHVRM